jgi:diacylglycerol kinase (ATP)
VKKKILFVINPGSGGKNKEDAEAVISRLAGQKDFDYKIFRTTGKDDQQAISRLLEEYKPGIVMAAGGDGTVNLVGTELMGKKISLGILPTGSANGLASNLQIPDNLEDALVKNLETESRPMDVIQLNDRYFCFHLADLGMNARIVKRFEQEGFRGMAGYGKQLLRELFQGKTYFTCFIKIPGEHRRKMKAEMVVIANAKSFGTGAIINPTGKLNDGKIELVIIRPYPWWFVFTFVYAAFLGKLHKMQYVRVFSASEASIRLKGKQAFQVDGEVLQDTGAVQVKVISNAVQMIGI